MNKTELMHFTLCKHFLENEDQLEFLINIIHSKSKIPMQLLDKFVTKVCKRHSIYIGGRNIYNQYKLTLKGLHLEYFDAFCREHKFHFYYKDTEFIETSIGQLAFIKWCFENGVIDYVTKNLDAVKELLSSSSSSVKSNSSSSSRSTSVSKRSKRSTSPSLHMDLDSLRLSSSSDSDSFQLSDPSSTSLSDSYRSDSFHSSDLSSVSVELFETH